MTTRCTVTELLPDQCAHCKPAPVADPFDAPRQLLGPWFTAQFASECAACWGGIEIFDRIRADGRGGYLCTDCGEDWG